MGVHCTHKWVPLDGKRYVEVIHVICEGIDFIDQRIILYQEEKQLNMSCSWILLMTGFAMGAPH